MDNKHNYNKAPKPLCGNGLRHFGGCKLQKQALKEKFPRHSESLHVILSVSEESKKHSYRHPEERSELRILPEKYAIQERWSDSEHTRLLQSRKDERFRMTTTPPSKLRIILCGYARPAALYNWSISK